LLPSTPGASSSWWRDLYARQGRVVAEERGVRTGAWCAFFEFLGRRRGQLGDAPRRVGQRRRGGSDRARRARVRGSLVFARARHVPILLWSGRRGPRACGHGARRCLCPPAELLPRSCLGLLSGRVPCRIQRQGQLLRRGQADSGVIVTNERLGLLGAAVLAAGFGVRGVVPTIAPILDSRQPVEASSRVDWIALPCGQRSRGGRWQSSWGPGDAFAAGGGRGKNDFLPGGKLAVDGRRCRGFRRSTVISALGEEGWACRYTRAAALASARALFRLRRSGGPWPEHCVAGVSRRRSSHPPGFQAAA